MKGKNSNTSILHENQKLFSCAIETHTEIQAVQYIG